MNFRHLVSAWLALAALGAAPQPAAADTSRAAQAMTGAAQALLDGSPPPQRTQLLQPALMALKGRPGRLRGV